MLALMCIWLSCAWCCVTRSSRASTLVVLEMRAVICAAVRPLGLLRLGGLLGLPMRPRSCWGSRLLARTCAAEGVLNARMARHGVRDLLGSDVSILRDRIGGQVKPLTLRRFRDGLDAQPGLFDGDDWGACGCFTGEAS